MKRTAKVTVGIDVTETQVSMVMLRRTGAVGTVLDAATVPIPAGTIEGGHITDPKALAKVLKAVKRYRARSGVISVSLPARGTLTRILPLTEQDPQRIGQFVREELKQYAVLSGRETVSDFRVLAPARADTRGAVLVAAADLENVAALASAGQQAGLQVGTIEPAAVACTRLLGTDRSAAAAACGTMVVLLKEATLTLCVFRRGLLDFVRTEVLEFTPEGANATGSRIAEEVAAVMRFYSLRHDAMKEWRILLADDARSSVLAQVRTTLEKEAAIKSISMVTPECLPGEWAIDLRGHHDVSLTALGLALRIDAPGADGASVNLLPAGVFAARSTRRNMYLVANAAAVLLLMIVLATGIIAYLNKRISQNIVAMKQASLKRGEYSLLVLTAEKALLTEQIQGLTNEVKHLKEIGAAHTSVDWVQFLQDVKNACPARQVQLTGLISNGGGVVTIRGNAISPDAVSTFVDVLNTSSRIREAARKEWNKKNRGLIEFEVECILSVEKAS